MITMRLASVLDAMGLLTVIVAGCAAPSRPIDTPMTPTVLVPVTCVGVVDGRARFREIYTAVRDDHGHALPEDRPVAEALHDLDVSPPAGERPVHVGPARMPLRIVMVPGLFGEYLVDLVSPFAHARTHLETHGYGTGMIVVSGRSSAEHNGRQIRDAVLAMDLAPHERIVLVGYSKGGVDIVTGVTEHPEIHERVAAVVSMCAPIGGSPIADDLDGLFLDLLERMDLPGLPLGDGGAINSLRRATRQAWLAAHALPSSVEFYSVVAFTERRQISGILQSGYDDLAKIDPRNDGMVLASDAVVPRGTLLAYLNGDHISAALPFTHDAPLLAGTVMDRNAFPRAVMLEAVVRFIEEDLLAAETGGSSSD